MRKLTMIIFVLWANILFGQTAYGDYYQRAEGLKEDALKAALYDIIKGHTTFPYTIYGSTDTWDILKETDKDPDNSENVILIYSGASIDAAQEYNNANGWTREHVWAKSRGDFGTDNGPGTDVHHLRPEDNDVNGERGNRSFDNCQDCEEVLYNNVATGSYIDKYEWTFEPRDEVKGDVARMLFYMATRYEGEGDELDLELTESIPSFSDSNPYHGRLSTLISWHREDPVSDWERNRNDIIFDQFQLNRNPYIDFPDLAEFIWGNAIGLTWSSTFSTFPKDGESDVDINTTIRYVFSEAIRNIDNTEITDANVANLITLKETNNTGVDVDFTASIDADKKVITVTPSSELKYSQVYYSSLEAVEDADENVNSFTEISFTTKEEDITPPTFTSDPDIGDTDVDIYTTFTVTFSEAIRNIDDSEITDANVTDLLTLKETDVNGTDVNFTATIDADKKVITATPSTDLKTNQLYYMVIEAVEDVNNNASTGKSMTFTTGVGITDSQIIISQYYEGVSGSDKFIEITNMSDVEVDLSSYYLGRFRNIDAPLDDAEYTDGDALSGTIAAGQTLIYKNSNAVNPSYAVSNAYASTTATYFNGDDPIALMKGGNTWRYRVDCIYASLTNGEWGLNKSFYRKASVVEGNKNISVLDGSGEWIEISIALVDIADSQSIEYLGTHIYGSNEGVDETAPIFTSVPANGATNVSINNSITFTFDEAIRNIDDSEITDSNVEALFTFNETDASGNDVAFTATIDEAKEVITVTPNTDLANDQVYYVSVASVEDINDNASSLAVLSFTTISEDDNPPFWTLDFETAGGYTTSVAEFTDDESDYFIRTDGSNIADNILYTNKLGSFFFGAQDIDGEGATVPQELYVDDIDISNRTISAFSVYLAEDVAGDGDSDWDNSDYVKFQYDVDNSGTFTDLFWIYGDGTQYNSQPSIDTDFDELGDGVNFLTASFTKFTSALSVSGTTLDIKVIFSLNAGDEDIAIDNLSLIENNTSTSINDLISNDISIYPNPSKGKFFVQMESSYKANTKIEVFNMMGKKVFETLAMDSKTEIDLSSMKQGIYFIRVIDGENAITKKIIKQ